MSLRLLLLKMGVTNEIFLLSGKIHVANVLFKNMQRGNVNAEALATIQLQQRVLLR
jgi:hypothetical protein